MPTDPIKVYDARWEVSEFDDAAVTRLFEATFAYARRIDCDTVTLCRDARLGCARVLEIGVNTAIRLGFRTFVRPEPISTPQSYFTTLVVSADHPRTMGLTVTASHNPASYIGVKFTVPTVAAIGQDCGPLDGLTKVKEIYHNGQSFPDVPGGSLEVLELSQAYLDFSLQQAGVKPGQLEGLSVVLDAFHGSAGPEVYRALRLAGCAVHPLRLIPNGAFPTGSPNPTSHGKMANAVALAKQTNAHAVLGIDGDGDRIVFGDSRGILTAGFAFVPILKAAGLTANKPQPVLYDPKVSPLALAEWGRLGAKCVLFRNGHSQIKDYMTQIHATAAAEESGHYYHHITRGNLSISGENSILTILLFLAALKQRAGLMDQLWAMQDRVFTTGEFNYQFETDTVRDQALAAVIADCVIQGASTQTTTTEGIDLQGTCLNKGVDLTPGNVRLEPGWFSGYLRVATNEKGVVRSYFSAADLASGSAIEARARAILGERFAGRIVE